jgi:hypothetical protein
VFFVPLFGVDFCVCFLCVFLSPLIGGISLRGGLCASLQFCLYEHVLFLLVDNCSGFLSEAVF